MTDPQQGLSTPLHVCAVCGRRLHPARLGGGEGEGFIHGHESDHIPVPVPESEAPFKARLVCDFAGEPDPTWVVVTRPYQLHIRTRSEEGVPASTTNTDNGLWFACTGCKGFFDRGDLPGLIHRVTRALSSNRQERRTIDKALLQPLYGHVFENFDRVERIAS